MHTVLKKHAAERVSAFSPLLLSGVNGLGPADFERVTCQYILGPGVPGSNDLPSLIGLQVKNSSE